MANSKPEDSENPPSNLEAQKQQGKGENFGENDPYALIERALGATFHVLAQDALCANKKLKDLYSSLLPAVAAKQFRIVRNDEGEAIAYASWALVSPEVEKKVSESQAPLTPSEWQSGETAMLIDLVCPDPKLAEGFVRRIKHEIFPGAVFKARKVSSNGNSSSAWVEVKAASSSNKDR